MLKKLVLLSFLFSTFLIKATQPTQKDGFSGNFDLGLSFTKNNESTFQFNNLFIVKYKKSNSNFSLENNIAFISKTGKDDLLNKGTQDFKYAVNTKKLDVNITLQNLYDLSRSVKNRYTSGVGIFYNSTDEEEKKIGVGLSVLKEKEIPLEGEKKIQNRMSSNLNLMIKISNNITISSSNYYQPNIEQVGDFRWKSNITLRITLSTHFLLNINSNLNYDSVPAEGIPETDYQLINSISYTF